MPRCRRQINHARNQEIKTAHVVLQAVFSGNDILDHFGVFDARQLAIQATVVIGQTVMVQAHQMQDCRMEVTEMVWLNHGLHSQFVGFTVGMSAFDSGTGHPVEKSLRVVVATPLVTL